MKIVNLPPEKLIPYERNPRKNEEAVEKVAKSLEAYGWRQPIVVDDKMVVIVGHTRLLAAQRLGMKAVPVLVAKDLTPEQVKAYRLADNRTHEEAEWDPELLKLEIADLDALGYNLELTGFDAKEIERALKTLDDTPADTSSQLDGLVFQVIVQCESEAQQLALLERFEKEGLACRALIS